MSTTPIFASTPIYQIVTNLSGANTNRGDDLSGANIPLLLTAGSAGSMFNSIRIISRGTNVATVLRVFLNNGGALNVANNNVLIGEISLPATTTSETVAQWVSEYPLGFPVPAGYRLYVALGTAVAAGYAISAYGLDF